MEKIKEIMNNNVTKTLEVLILAILIYIIIRKIINKTLKSSRDKTKGDSKEIKQKATYIIMVESIIKYIYFIVVFLLILEVNGVNISSLITGLGIVGVIVGLAVQDALKDIIMGKNIIADRYFSVGDVIKFENIMGKVLSIGLKTTKIQDLSTDDIVSIANRNIDKIINISGTILVEIPAPYEQNIDYMENVIINQIVPKVKEIKDVKECKYQGVNAFASSNMVYLMKVYCIPDVKLQVNRDSLRVVKKIFDKNNIEIPYTQIDLHNK